MIRRIALLLALLPAIWTGGCQKGKGPTDPPAPQLAGLELCLPLSRIAGFPNEHRTMQITARAIDEHGNPLPGVLVDFGIQDWEAWMGRVHEDTDSGSVTDAEGNCSGTYEIWLSAPGEFQFRASSSEFEQVQNFEIAVRQDTLGVVVVESVDTLKAPYVGSTGATIRAHITNNKSRALSEVLTRFALTPDYMGTISADTATSDELGFARVTFSSSPGRFGEATITASAGDSSGSTRIVIIPQMAPEELDLVLGVPQSEFSGAAGEDLVATFFIIVYDRWQNVVPGAPIQFTLTHFELESNTQIEPFGRLDAPAQTGDDGGMWCRFHSEGEFGRVAVAIGVPSAARPGGFEVKRAFELKFMPK